MFRLILLLAAFTVCAAPKPLFEVDVKEKMGPNGVELTYTLINNSGRSITGVEIVTHALTNSGSTGVRVLEFPEGINLSAKRIPLPSSASFTSSAPNYKPSYKVQIVSVTFADGSTWHGPPFPER